MKASANCISVIKHYERFVSKPYLCPANVPTIGYGTTVYPNGKKVTLKDKPIDEPTACEYLAHDVIEFENVVNQCVKTVISQNQFDALVSLTYNIGGAGLRQSSLLAAINKNIIHKDVAWKRVTTMSFCMWVKATVKGKRVTLAGLVARRQTEAWLFTENAVRFFNA